MIEHWYEYLPAAWFIPEARWYVAISILLLMGISFAIGFILGKKLNKPKVSTNTIKFN